MALIIESAEAEELAIKLAHLRGESVDNALVHALQADLVSEGAFRHSPLERKKTPEEIEAGVARLMGIGRQVVSSPDFKHYTAKEIDDWLYDENGLPH